MCLFIYLIDFISFIILDVYKLLKAKCKEDLWIRNEGFVVFSRADRKTEHCLD